jgi:hypothetical protein
MSKMNNHNINLDQFKKILQARPDAIDKGIKHSKKSDKSHIFDVNIMNTDLFDILFDATHRVIGYVLTGNEDDDCDDFKIDAKVEDYVETYIFKKFIQNHC